MSGAGHFIEYATACPPDCKLCAIAAKVEAHYSLCLTCHGAGFPCPKMQTLLAEEQAVLIADAQDA